MSRKPKTPLLAFLQRACHAAMVCESTETSVEALEERRFAHHRQHLSQSLHLNRREFLKSTLGAAALSGLLLSTPKAMGSSQTSPRIAIVGGGIAGLNAAYQLKKAGYHSTIYEGSAASSWGRIQTRQYHGNKLTAELGGEFIDTGHADMRQLAREFRLPLINLVDDTSRSRLIKDSYYFGGKHYSEREVIQKFRPLAGKIKADADSLPNSISYNSSALPEAVKKLDHTSIEQYLKDKDHLGLQADWLYDLLNVAYTSEFGLEIGEQSSLNFLTMISTDLSHGFEIFGESDEKYRIRGGNSKLIEALIDKLKNQIETNRQLETIRQKDGKYTLHFSSGPEVPADYLILAIPFSTLRKVDLKRVALTAQKRAAIHKLGYGTNSKLLLDVSSRVWREQKRAGYLFSEKVHNGWDNSQGQMNNRGEGGYTVFIGGEAGRNLRENQAGMYVDNLEGAFKGFRQAQTVTQVINWSERPLSEASYACYKVGQWTTLAGAEFEPDGNLYFCGEHCSQDYQGYMNGGAETGGAVAANLLRKLKRTALRTGLRV
jgi:monoamine oxidase